MYCVCHISSCHTFRTQPKRRSSSSPWWDPFLLVLSDLSSEPSRRSSSATVLSHRSTDGRPGSRSHGQRRRRADRQAGRRAHTQAETRRCRIPPRYSSRRRVAPLSEVLTGATSAGGRLVRPTPLLSAARSRRRTRRTGATRWSARARATRRVKGSSLARRDRDRLDYSQAATLTISANTLLGEVRARRPGYACAPVVGQVCRVISHQPPNGGVVTRFARG
jgi:hypothetical protein